MSDETDNEHPYRAQLPPDPDFGHEPIAIPREAVEVAMFRLMPPQRRNAGWTQVQADPRQPVPEDWYVVWEARFERAFPGSTFRGKTADLAIDRLLEQPRPCEGDCTACQAQAERVFEDHEQDFGPYLGSLGGLDTEFIERKPPTMPTDDRSDLAVQPMATQPAGDALMQTEKRTRQGVRDLNPKGYNGKNAACPCYGNPEIPTRIDYQLREIKKMIMGVPKLVIKHVGVHLCTYCGRDRGSEYDED